jgi:hypothetical protein
MKNNLRTLFLALAAICLTAPLFAQFDSATVLGTLKDRSDATIPNAKIVLRNTQTNVEQTVSSDESGNYQFLTVKIGRYQVSAEAKGFKKASSPEFQVTVNAKQRVDLLMEVGEVTETVTVSEAVSVLESESSSRGTVVSAQQIQNLPLNGRAYADLALLAPGVRRSLISASRDASFNVNGMRSSQNNFIIDGVDNNAYGTSNQGFSSQAVQLSPDAVQEFRIETNNFSAEFGRAGGAVINATVRSGTNSYHGAAWHFLRNTDLNTAGFFKNDVNRDGRVDGGDKPTLIQNQFGAAIGGPIVKNKMFFFADYEGFRRISKSPAFATVPLTSLRTGNFGSIAIRNPLDGASLPGNIVPANQITPFARDLFAALATPNLAGTANNLATLPRRADQNDKGDIRYDQYFSEKVNAFARYSHRLLNNLEPASIPGIAGGDSNGNVRVLNQQMAFGGNFNLTATSLAEFRMGVTLTEGGKNTLYNGQPNVYETYRFPNGPTNPRFTGGFYRQGIGGYTALGVQGSNPQFQNPYVLNPKFNYTKILSRHTLKTGYEFQRIETEVDDFNPKYGSDDYSGRFSRVSGGGQNEHNIVDFLYGARSNYSLNNDVIINLRQHMHFLYLQDDWKVNQKLTLNLGVRYELGTPQWEQQNRIANFDEASNKLIFATDGSVSERALVNTDTNNWAPRIGLAYRFNDKTVFRAAYGISYIHFNRMGGENLLSFNLPFVVGPSIPQQPISQGGTAALPICTSQAQAPGTCFRTREQGYPDNLLSVANVNQVNVRANHIPRNLKSGYVQSFHFTVQRQLPLGFVLDLGYVGTRGDKLMILGDLNQARPNAPTENTALNARRPIPGFGFIQTAFDGGFLEYNGLQAKIERRYSNGLFLLNSFTYSSAYDNAAGHLEAVGDNSRVNFRNLDGERGYSNYDQRWNNTTTVVYELPFGKGKTWMTDANFLVQGLLGGWRFNAIHTANAGLPLNLTYSPQATFQVSGAPSYRANVIGNPVFSDAPRFVGNQVLYLDPAAVVEPTDRSLPFGNAFRNAVRGPKLLQLDMGLHKNFPIREQMNIEFRFEAFNLFNRTNFILLNGNRTSPAFGTINSTFDPRQLQFALKLNF